MNVNELLDTIEDALEESAGDAAFRAASASWM